MHGDVLLCNNEGDKRLLHGKEANEDRDQNHHDNDKDQEGGLGIDTGADQADEEADEEQDGAIKQLVPVGPRKDVDRTVSGLSWK
ncbi:hypothetical protein FKM82_028013 [Ascaphus truei]